MKKLANNGQLHEYLTDLGTKLMEPGANDLGEAALVASRSDGTFPATEFLGESRIALRQIQAQNAVLNEIERSELADVLDQLDKAFQNRY